MLLVLWSGKTDILWEDAIIKLVLKRMLTMEKDGGICYHLAATGMKAF